VPFRQHLRYLTRLGLVAVAYYGAAKLGLATGFLKGNVTAVWPPTGLALAVLVLYGVGLWPAVALGALLVNGLSGPVPVIAACGMAAGNTLEAVLGAYLLRRCVGFRPSLLRVRDVLGLAGLAAGLSTLVSATVGVASLWAAGIVPSHAVMTTGRVWWGGDALGDLVVAPALLLALGTPRLRRRLAHNLARDTEGLLLLAVVVASTIFAFYVSGYPYAILPVVAWAAMRFGPKGAAATALVVSGIAVYATAGGIGPFASAVSSDGLLVLDAFLAVVALTALVLSAVVSERDEVQAALRASNDELEAKVAARTSELEATEGRFKALVEGIPDFAIYMLDPEGRVLSWNTGAERLMGYAADEIVGHSFARFHRPEDVEGGTPARALQLARSIGRFEEEAWRVRADGSAFWARVVVTPLVKNGTLVGFAQVTHDVTAPREAQTALHQVVAELADAQRVAHIGSFRVDVLAGEVAYWSEELFRILGLDPAVFQPSFGALVERVHPDDRARVDAAVGAGFQESGQFNVEARIVRDNGQIRVVAASAHVKRDAEGQPRYMVGVCQDVTDRKAAEDALTHAAAHDGLTGLPNRTIVLDRLSVALARRDRVPGQTAVFFVDIDRFKRLNDKFGHAAGDQVLVEVARRLEAGVRPGDTVARFGGDEFVMVCENLNAEGIAAMAPRLMSMVAHAISVDGEKVTPTASIGIAVSDADGRAGETASSLVSNADAAMYKAKKRGRARFEIFDSDMRAAVENRLETESALRRALDGNEIVVYFQPVIDLATGRAVGAEALARWAHPTRGLVLPDEFIPLAEESGLIVQLGASVLMSACEQVADWRRLSPALATLEVAVNLSARQLLHPTMIDTVRQALGQSGLAPHALCLEITESVLLDDADLAASVVNKLKSLGVRIALDDFGTGFSSLTYLKRLPVDVLKIDRSFVQDLGASRGDAAIVAGVIDLANSFAMSTVAEGVETAAQARELATLGCGRAQGYLWSKPVPAADALEYMRSLLGIDFAFAKQERTRGQRVTCEGGSNCIGETRSRARPLVAEHACIPRAW
jgi:diguanylate cyclase (GGDEF)-like protein/PAS domain S-box-containing protein